MNELPINDEQTPSGCGKETGVVKTARTTGRTATVIAAAAIAAYLLAAAVDPHLRLLPFNRLTLLNGLPLLLGFLAVWSVVGRPALAGLIITAFTGGFFLANHVKLRFLSDVLIPGDLRLVTQIIASPDFFFRYAAPGFLFLAASLAFLLLAIALVRHEPRWVHLSITMRASVATSAVLGFLAVTTPPLPPAQLYSLSSLSVDPRPSTSARQAGLIATFIRLSGESRIRLPRHDPDDLHEFRLRYGHLADEMLGASLPDTLPDIIAVMSESFFDPAILNEVEDVPQLRHFRRLQDVFIHGDLSIPTGVGGGTLRTEFEFLTGHSLDILTQHPYPYLSLVRRPMHGLPRALKDVGYRTVAMHPFRASFWNRYNVYPHLGFERFLSEAYFPKHRDGFFISDSVFVEQLISELDENIPQFIFAVSMEGHGPWTGRKVIDNKRREEILVPAGTTEETARELQAFLYHLENADRALKRLYEAVVSRSRPTVVLFFGDHLPVLHKTFDAFGFQNGLSAEQQSVPYLLFSNRPIATARIDTCSFFLGGLLLQAAGVTADKYFVQSAIMREQSNAFQYLEDGVRCALPYHLTIAQQNLQLEALSHR
jgi:hypothetical protein